MILPLETPIFDKKRVIFEENVYFLWFQQTHMTILEIKLVRFNKLELKMIFYRKWIDLDFSTRKCRF